MGERQAGLPVDVDEPTTVEDRPVDPGSLPVRTGFFRPLLLASLIAHAALLALLLLTRRPDLPPPEAASNGPIAVTILSAEQMPKRNPVKPKPLPTPVQTEEQKPVPEKPVSVPDTLPADNSRDGMTKASHMMAADVLADPRSAGARKALNGLEANTRLDMLCGIEAMAQIAASTRTLHPDQIVLYAMVDPVTRGKTLEADGAAFRSGGMWQQVKLRCGFDAAARSVTSFAFQLGALIPKDQWAEHYLAAGDSAD